MPHLGGPILGVLALGRIDHSEHSHTMSLSLEVSLFIPTPTGGHRDVSLAPVARL